MPEAPTLIRGHERKAPGTAQGKGLKHHRGGGEGPGFPEPLPKRGGIEKLIERHAQGPGQQRLQLLPEGRGGRRKGLPEVAPKPPQLLLPHRCALLKPILIEALKGMVDERRPELRFRQGLGHGALRQIALEPPAEERVELLGHGPLGGEGVFDALGEGRTKLASGAVQGTLQPPALLLSPEAFGGEAQHRLIPGKERPQCRALDLEAARQGRGLAGLTALGQGGLKRPEPLPLALTAWDPSLAQCSWPFDCIWVFMQTCASHWLRTLMVPR